MAANPNEYGSDAIKILKGLEELYQGDPAAAAILRDVQQARQNP